jgi:hypothetical protein
MRDRAGFQHLRVLPRRLLDRPHVAAHALPRAHRLNRRRRARCHPRERDRGLRDEPPQQHGLHHRVVPRRRARGPVVRRWRAGARAEAAAADPLEGRAFRARQLEGRVVPAHARAPNRARHRGRGHAGGLRRRRFDEGRVLARAALGRARLHASRLSLRRRARPRLRAARTQLRPCARRPLAVARRRPDAGPPARQDAHAAFPRPPLGARAAWPLAPLRLRLRQLRHPGLGARLVGPTGPAFRVAGECAAAVPCSRGRRAPDGTRRLVRAGVARGPGGERAAGGRSATPERTRDQGRRWRTRAATGVAGRICTCRAAIATSRPAPGFVCCSASSSKKTKVCTSRARARNRCYAIAPTRSPTRWSPSPHRPEARPPRKP